MDSINIISPNQKIEGYSQAQLGDIWWQTVYELPADQHFGRFDDNKDLRGKRGSVEKSQIAQPDQSPAFFIGGAFGDLITGVGGISQINRTIILPNKGNTTVFFPILNATANNLTNDISTINPEDPFSNGNRTVEQLKEQAAFFSNPIAQGGLVSDLFAMVDRKKINNPFAYRQASENPFSYTPPKNNILEEDLGYTENTYLANPEYDPNFPTLKELGGFGKVEISPEVANGYWLAVKVAGGDHTLNFGGTFTVGGEPFFSLDITYNILNQVLGTRKNDHLQGTQGNDYIDGGKGKDYLFGLNGEDLLVAGDGNDVINGGRGNDELWGDAGKDLFIFKPGYGADNIFDFEHGEKIDISAFKIQDLSKIGKTDITLESKLDTTQIDLGGGNQLILVGIAAQEVAISRNTITLI
ncbi:hypothetical protein H6G41_07190 [Tolypothrix sp. FACHB-123]|uniref:calcium-binding protein n=1 Tax=Tolypothrix sp. FACHB-123 TaxID=2692868 RepID=UPI001684D46F|nr:hypothetical protein [Tolypothrix sp. FACHB-123]MBD2354411.1 hypothetical protein [Tolypothrix sp. FACHB-123]